MLVMLKSEEILIEELKRKIEAEKILVEAKKLVLQSLFKELERFEKSS